MKVRAGLLAAALVGASVVAAASPAGAASKPINEGGDTRPCVTYEEFQAVFLGMPLHRARRIIDTRGERLDASQIHGVAEAFGFDPIHKGMAVRRYPSCASPELEQSGGWFYIQYKPTSPRKRISMTEFQD